MTEKFICYRVFARKNQKKGIVEVQRTQNADRRQQFFAVIGIGSAPCPTASSYSKASTCHTLEVRLRDRKEANVVVLLAKGERVEPVLAKSKSRAIY
jgi:hypothetical protein